MSNIMGMGGYFIIKSVEYNLGQTPGEFEINISTKFLGTDATKALTRKKGGSKAISDKAECAAIFNVIAERFNVLAEEGEGVELATIKGTPESEAAAAASSSTGTAPRSFQDILDKEKEIEANMKKQKGF